MARPRIGLALGGGSARGWSHIGIIESLLEAGIEPDIVCGTSIGSLVGAAHVAGRLTELREWAEVLGWREIIGQLDPRLLGGGLIEGKQIVGFLRDLGITGQIEDFARPYAAIASDLNTGEEVRLTSGPIDEAVRASIALPGIFSPARIDDKWLLDGGLVNPVPVSACRELGADIVIAVNLNNDLAGRRQGIAGLVGGIRRNRVTKKELLDRIQQQMPVAIRRQAALIVPKLLRTTSAGPGYFEVIANSIYIMQYQITQARLAVEKPQVILTPNLGDIGVFEFNRAKEAISGGRACVAEALSDIRKHI
jgi:NTE family protein